VVKEEDFVQILVISTIDGVDLSVACVDALMGLGHWVERLDLTVLRRRRNRLQLRAEQGFAGEADRAAFGTRVAWMVWSRVERLSPQLVLAPADGALGAAVLQRLRGAGIVVGSVERVVEAFGVHGVERVVGVEAAAVAVAAAAAAG
jgi:hypothetical protein